MSTVGSAMGQTPTASPSPPNYENTCDGAQAYFDDLHEVSRVRNELDLSMAEENAFYLAYFQNSNPPPILEEWVDASAALFGAFTDFTSYTDFTALLDAIYDAEEELEDVCEDYPFTESFWG
jgi:hypothetical protein